MKEIQLFSHAIDSKSRTRTARAFGIDLGTTNSSVAEASWASGEKPVCGVLEIDQPLWPAGTMTSSLAPSVVAVLDSDGLKPISELSKKPETVGVIGKVFFMGWKRPPDRGNARNGEGKKTTERQPGTFRKK